LALRLLINLTDEQDGVGEERSGPNLAGKGQESAEKDRQKR
jgi:hypothetical protein